MLWSALSQYGRKEAAQFRTSYQRNISIFKAQPWSEISGAFGDIGTFIPIFIALCRGNPDFNGRAPLISAGSTLVFSGLANVFTGCYFGIPLPVQPMKAIAAVVIAAPWAYDQASVASAGLFTAAAVAILSLTGLVQWFTKAIPVPIVKGIQVSAGLKLITSGIKNFGAVRPGVAWRLDHTEAICFAAALVMLFICTVQPRWHYVGIVMIVAACAAVYPVVKLLITEPLLTVFTFWNPRAMVPGWAAFKHGAFDAGLGQLPLTTLNSIVAVVFLAEDLLPDAAPPSATAVGMSVALMNLVGCWFCAMPVCHGSGGLAAQYRFGARSGSSIIFLGLLKIMLGLFMSELLLRGLDRFPVSVLGILLILSGIELAKMGESVNTAGARDLWRDDDGDDQQKRYIEPDNKESMRRYLLMMWTVAATLGWGNLGWAFLSSLGLFFMFKVVDWTDNWRERREGRIRLEDGQDT